MRKLKGVWLGGVWSQEGLQLIEEPQVRKLQQLMRGRRLRQLYPLHQLV